MILYRNDTGNIKSNRVSPKSSCFKKHRVWAILSVQRRQGLYWRHSSGLSCIQRGDIPFRCWAWIEQKSVEVSPGRRLSVCSPPDAQGMIVSKVEKKTIKLNSCMSPQSTSFCRSQRPGGNRQSDFPNNKDSHPHNKCGLA